MCGLVGVAGTIDNTDIKVFNDLLFFDTVRGPHSTGVAAVSQRDEFHLIKKTGPASDLMDLKSYDKVVASYTTKVLIGHNRFATIGKINNANAHPFAFDTVVGAHNGTLDWDARRKLIDHDKYDTDSEALIRTINDLGPQKAIGSVWGAWALTWYDNIESRLFFLRNDQRPFYYVLSESEKTLYWASEPGLLIAALGRHGVKIWKRGIMATMENQMYAWDIPGSRKTFDEPERIEVKGGAKEVTAPFRSTRTNGTSGQGARVTTEVGDYDFSEEEEAAFVEWQKRRGVAPTSQQTSTQKTTSNVQALNPPTAKVTVEPLTTALSAGRPKLALPGSRTFRGYLGEDLTEEEFTKRTGCVCAYCTTVVTFGDPVRFFSKNEFLCETCMKDELIVNIAGMSKQENAA